MNLTDQLENQNKFKSNYEAKKNRYINNYYKCYGAGCNLDWRTTPNLFSKRATPFCVKECWKCLNLEPKYYNNRCRLCSFLSSVYKDKNSIREVLRVYKKKGKSFKFTTEDQLFIDKLDVYNKYLDYEEKELTNLLTETRNQHNNSLAIELENKFNKMKSYYDKEILELKKRISVLESDNIT